MKLIGHLPLETLASAIATYAMAVAVPPMCVASCPRSGLTCDVRNFGAAGDGVTDDAPAINRALAEKIRPLVVRIPKGVYLIGETLKVGSFTSIEAEPGARLVLSGAWKKKKGDFLLMNADAEGGDEQISVRGGTWDGNARDGHNVKDPDLFAKDAWSGATVNFRNVKGLSLSNMEMANSVTFNIRMCEIDGFEIRDIAFSARNCGWNQDGLHFNGFCRNGRIENIRAVTKGQTTDDLLAFNADDSLSRLENFGMVCGPIENIAVKNVFAEDCLTAIRFLSVTSTISNVHIENVRTGCRLYAINADAARYCRTPLFKEREHPNGVGMLSNVTIDNFTFYATYVSKEPLFCMETNADGVRFSNLSRDMARDIAPMRPFMQARKTYGMRIVLDDTAEQLPSGGSIAVVKTPKSLLLDAANGDVNKKAIPRPTK